MFEDDDPEAALQDYVEELEAENRYLKAALQAANEDAIYATQDVATITMAESLLERGLVLIASRRRRWAEWCDGECEEWEDDVSQFLNGADFEG